MATITVSLPSDGDTIDVADYNTPINTIVNEINGSLNADNLAANAVTTAKIADGNVTNAKLSTTAGEPGGAWTAWTPTISATTGSFTTTSAAGRYIKIGKTVHFTIAVTITTVGTGSGARFTLPVIAQTAVGTVGYYRERAVTGLTGVITLASTTLAGFFEYDNTMTIANGWVFQGSGTYEAE
jgi:hypothetical protein